MLEYWGIPINLGDIYVVSQVGKSLVIKSLVKHYTKQNISEVRGPITVVTGEFMVISFPLILFVRIELSEAKSCVFFL